MTSSIVVVLLALRRRPSPGSLALPLVSASWLRGVRRHGDAHSKGAAAAPAGFATTSSAADHLAARLPAHPRPSPRRPAESPSRPRQAGRRQRHGLGNCATLPGLVRGTAGSRLLYGDRRARRALEFEAGRMPLQMHKARKPDQQFTDDKIRAVGAIDIAPDPPTRRTRGARQRGQRSRERHG